MHPCSTPPSLRRLCSSPATPLAFHARRRSVLRQLALLATATVAWLPCGAQAAPPAPTGVISGHVFNPVTGEYVRNAEVQLQGSTNGTTSGDGGFYRLVNVPVGTATVTVTYTGYDIVSSTVNVAAGETSVRDFQLTPSTASAHGGGKEETVLMQAFVVSNEREGNAKAIMTQRGAMNIVNSVASDTYGDVAEGNVGEFLKYMPGLDVDYSEADSHNARIRGMPAQYVSVTLDGLRIASADAYPQFNSLDNAGVGNSTRSFGFEQTTINSVESIEVFKTSGANIDANAPAGTINLRSKHAFDRKGRRVSWQANLSSNSEGGFRLQKTYGPFDEKTYKLRPGGIFEYSDQFLNGRAGIVLNISESNTFRQQYRVDTNYDTSTTNAPLVSSIALKQGPKFTERFGTTLTADFKVTPSLIVGLTTIYNWYHDQYNNQSVQLNAFSGATGGGGRVSVAGLNGGDPVVGFASAAAATTTPLAGTNAVTTASNGATFQWGGAASDHKLGHTITIAPKVEFAQGNWNLDAKGNYSSSKNTYAALDRGVAQNTPTQYNMPVTFQAQRSSSNSSDWRIVQTGGANWSDLASFTPYTPRLQGESRFASVEIYNGQIDAKYKTGFAWPTFFQTGIKGTQTIQNYRYPMSVYKWNYRPDGVNNGNYANYVTPLPWSTGPIDATVTSLTGQGVVFPNRTAIASLYQAHPEYFVPAATYTDYLTGFIKNAKDYTEQIDAAYLMANTRIKRLQLEAGVRLEKTIGESKEFNPLTKEQMFAKFPFGYADLTSWMNALWDKSNLAMKDPAGLPVGSMVMYQYTSQPRIARSTSDYRNYFPSVNGKYILAKNLIAQFGFNQTIGRPDFNNITGMVLIDEDNKRISISNPGLKPEYSNNYSARLAYYFEPVGTFAVGAYENDIKNKANSITYKQAGQAFGYTDYPDYDVVTMYNALGHTRYKGIELEYSQTLAFLPKPLDRTGVFLNFTRTSVGKRVTGCSPHVVAGGLDFHIKGVNFRLNERWTDDTPTIVNPGAGISSEFRRRRILTDISGNYQFYKSLSFFFQGQNILDVPDRIYVVWGHNPAIETRRERYGAVWTMGVKDSF